MPELGVTIVRFANGVEGWFKPTDFKNDQVLFSLTASGGASLAPTPLYPEATAGAGARRALRRRRAQRRRSAEAARREDRRRRARSYPRRRTAFRARARPRTSRPALQLLNLNFTAPGRRPAGVRADSQAARSGVRQSRQQSRAAVPREAVAGEHEQSLHVAAADARPDRQARSRRDGVVLQASVSRTPPTSRSSWSVRSSSTRRFRSSRATSVRCRRPARRRARFADLGIKFPAASERVDRRERARAAAHRRS